MRLIRPVLALLASGAILSGCSGNLTLPGLPAAPANPAAVEGADAQTIDGAKALAQEEIDRYGAPVTQAERGTSSTRPARRR